jgi:hypothetical protein
MNDTELDLLLDTWEAPLTPASLREGLQTRFPRPERRINFRRLRWGLGLAVASVTLTFAVAQTGNVEWVRPLSQMIDNLRDTLEAWRTGGLVARIRESEPKVYVDGQLAAPLKFRRAKTMEVEVPGEGVYSIFLYYRKPDGWIEAGRVHGNAIEFQVGSKRVRIECNGAITDSELPVFVRRQ